MTAFQAEVAAFICDKLSLGNGTTAAELKLALMRQYGTGDPNEFAMCALVACIAEHEIMSAELGKRDAEIATLRAELRYLEEARESW